MASLRFRWCLAGDAEAPGLRADGVGAGLRGGVKDAQELLLVEDHLLAAEAGEVVEGGEFDRIDRAGFLAHPAVNATQLVDYERFRVLLAAVLLPLGRGRGGDDVDAVGRAGGGAHVARHAFNASGGVAVEPVDAAV